MKKLILTAAACAAIAANAFTVTDVTARQRWPWNNLVDVDFTINGDAGDAYYIDISATAAGGEKRLCATSFETEPIAATGRNRVVWNLGADYPNFKADDLRVTVTATPFSDSTPLYLVVDISGGMSAAKWPVRYTTTAPVHTAGVADPCKTTELWLKRVKAKGVSFASGGGTTTGNWYLNHTCTLTNDYYLGVFSLTQQQCYNISGSYQSNFTVDRETRPVDAIRHEAIRTPYFDSANPNVELTGGLLKNLRDRTALKFDMPSEWQWEYACKAGTGAKVYPGAEFRSKANSQPPDDYEYKDNQSMWSADYGTSYVDAYGPNPWGFYGMLGNVWEYCVNYFQTITLNGTYTDPMGDSNTGWARQRRGGAWDYDASYSGSYYRSGATAGSDIASHTGTRICLTIGK